MPRRPDFKYLDDQGNERREAWSARRTERCQDGRACTSPLDDDRRAYVPDGQSVCDACLLIKFELTCGTHDGCNDPYGMDTLYHEEDVVRALRLATAKEEA